jgi:hypothetical protein
MAVLGVALAPSGVALAIGVLTVMAIGLSLGVNGTLFAPLQQVFPPVDGLRAFARFAVLALLGASILCGLAVAGLLEARTLLQRRLLAVVFSALVMAEYWIAPVETYNAPLRPGALERWLAQQPTTVIAAVPFPRLEESSGYETVFQYLSTFHWQPMVNGYSGHTSPAYRRLAAAMQHFPSADSVQLLRERGAQLVIFDEHYSEPGQFDRYLYACHNPAWFDKVHVFAEQGRGRAAACRLTRETLPSN